MNESINRRSAADATHRDADTVTCHTVQADSNQDIANVTKIVGKPDDHHGDAFKPGHLADVLHTQQVFLACAILGIGRKSICAFTGKQLQITRKDYDSCAVVSGKLNCRKR